MYHTFGFLSTGIELVNGVTKGPEKEGGSLCGYRRGCSTDSSSLWSSISAAMEWLRMEREN